MTSYKQQMAAKSKLQNSEKYFFFHLGCNNTIRRADQQEINAYM